MRPGNVELHPAAAEEVERAHRWYLERSPQAAAAFLAEVDLALERVTEAPHRWPEVRGPARRYVFPTFPFSVVYWIKDDIVEVIAVAHGRRRPGYWEHRR